MNIQFAIDGQPCCLQSLHAITRERKDKDTGDWLHYPFIELRTLDVSMEQSTGNLKSEIVDRHYFEPTNAVGYTELDDALEDARAWVFNTRDAMAATIQEDYGNGLP